MTRDHGPALKGENAKRLVDVASATTGDPGRLAGILRSAPRTAKITDAPEHPGATGSHGHSLDWTQRTRDFPRATQRVVDDPESVGWMFHLDR
jgi:hypothetical protein